MKNTQEMRSENNVALQNGAGLRIGQPHHSESWPNDRRDCQRPQVEVSSASRVVLRLFDELAYGLIVLDAARRVVHINRAARGALTRERCVRVRGRALEAWRERDNKLFVRALEIGFTGKRASMKIGELQGTTQSTILVVPLPGSISTDALSASQIGHIALVFERSACAESLSIAFYAQNYGLTCGEERVLRALNEDQSVGEVAGSLGTAISTIRTHVNHIREKTGARSLRALVANLRSVPALMPAVGD